MWIEFQCSVHRSPRFWNTAYEYQGNGHITERAGVIRGSRCGALGQACGRGKFTESHFEFAREAENFDILRRTVQGGLHLRQEVVQRLTLV